MLIKYRLKPNQILYLQFYFKIVVFAIFYCLFVIFYCLFAIFYCLFVKCYSRFAISYFLFAISFFSFIMFCLLCIIFYSRFGSQNIYYYQAIYIMIKMAYDLSKKAFGNVIFYWLYKKTLDINHGLYYKNIKLK